MDSLRNSFKLLVIVLVVGTSTVAVRSQAAQPEGVRLFNAKDGVGMSQDIPVGNFQVDGKQLGAEASVKVSAGYVIRFCSEKDGTGKCEEFGQGTHNLTSVEFNSIRVWKGALSDVSAPVGTTASATAAVSKSGPPPVVVFEQKNWGGRSQVFGPGMYRSFRGEFGKLNDNQARSIVVAKGFRTRFCAEEGIFFRGAGDCEIHEEGKHNLRFANSISFIQVFDLADTAPADDDMPVVLYEDASQAGKMQGFDVGSFFASEGQFRKLPDNQASSISVKSGYRASVCADGPTAAAPEPSNCEEFTAGRKNLKSRKTASYLRVFKENK